MYELAEFLQTLTKLANVLDESGVDYCLTGGAAVIAYGDPRTTQDVDLVISAEMLRAKLNEFLERMKAAGFHLAASVVADAVNRGRQFQAFDETSSMKIDFYPRELLPGTLLRAERMELFPSVAMPVVARSDLAISKLDWIHRGIHKARRDLRWLMRESSDRDRDEVRRGAEALNLSPLLTDVLNESDELE